MIEITHKTVNDLVDVIERGKGVKFVCINDNFLYKMAMKKLAKKLGIIKELSDKFLENYAVTMPWMFGKNIVVTPYRFDDKKIDPVRKLSLIAHEFQHVIDAQEKGFKKFYSDYVENSAKRAVYEARAIGAEIEVLSFIGHQDRKTSQFGSMIYMFNHDDLAVITKHIDRVKKNQLGTFSDSARLIKDYFLNGI